MATAEYVTYLLALQASSRARVYLFGPSPDDLAELWYFEAVDDGGERIAIRQLTVQADGSRHAYSPQHVADEWGALTDQPIDYVNQLSACSAEDFLVVWGGE